MKRSTDLRRQLLVTLGLSSKEAVLYETLLKHGSLSAAQLERATGLKKNTYPLLKSLERRGLVQKFIRDNRSHYQVGSPTRLQSYLEDQEHALSETRALLTESLPSLLNDYKNVVDRPVINYYSRLTGLRTVFDEVYKEGKNNVYGCLGNESPDPIFHKEIINKYKPLRVKNNIFAHVISPDSPRARKLKNTEAQDLKKKYLIDPIKYPMPAEFDTWDDKIAMMSFAQKDFSAILIQHPDLATTLQSLLQLSMDLLSASEQKCY